MIDICDFVDGSGITECPDCGEIVETEFDEKEEIDTCPYCYNGKYMYGDIWMKRKGLQRMIDEMQFFKLPIFEVKKVEKKTLTDKRNR